MIPNAMAYAAQGRGKGQDMWTVQCFSCKEYGNVAINYTRKFCNYCKKPGHIIKECPTCPQNRPANAYQATMSSTSSATTSDSTVHTTEKVQEMIISALSALELQGNSFLSPSWIIDSGASNHMTGSSNTLSNVRNILDQDTFRLLMVVGYLFMLLEMLIPLLEMFLYLLSFPLVLFPSGNWLIITMMLIFLMMVVLCRIRCRARYLRRGLKLDIYFRVLYGCKSLKIKNP